MTNVNQEWEEALRWIASWDEAMLLQQQPQAMNVPVLPQGVTKLDELVQHAYSTILDDKREDFGGLVQDLSVLLQTCIDTCLREENFDLLVRKDDNDHSNLDGALSGNVKRSLVSWVFGDSLFRIPKTGLGYVNSFFIGMTRLLVVSIACYTLHFLGYGSPMLLQWYESISGREDHSPAWLLEHEKELEIIAKKSRQRKNSKKSKRKGSNKRLSSQRQSDKEDANAEKFETQSSSINNAIKKDSEREDVSIDIDKHAVDDNSWENYYLCPQTHSETVLETNQRSSKDKDPDDIVKDHHDGVPSSISIFSTSSSSYTVSNTEHSEDRNLSGSTSFEEPTRPPATLQNRTLNRPPLIMNSPPRKPLLVPTQEQRNLAAQRLREFQNAQIQRLMYQKKLSQSFKASSSSAVTSTSATAVSPPNSSLSSPQTQVLKPPPGFANPSDFPKSDMLEDTFLADNELLLSKLLDDDDNVDILSTDSGINSFPQESSLDPAAAPFVLEGFDAKEIVSPSNENKCDSKWDTNHGRPMPSLSDTMMKGVYGGSVW